MARGDVLYRPGVAQLGQISWALSFAVSLSFILLNLCLFQQSKNWSNKFLVLSLQTSVADPHNFDADPGPSFHLWVDPDLTFQFYADPEPPFHFDPAPNPDPVSHQSDANL
jgi:hypothetical protein